MSAGGGGGDGDVELNLAPIIDCFTVLITYLLVTASFISLAAVDVGVSATGTAAPPTEENPAPPPMVMTLELATTGDVEIAVRGGVANKEYKFRVPAKGGQRDDEGLIARLEDVKSRWPSLKEASVSAEPTVVYKDVVRVIRKIQEAMPKVFIAG